jgi:hypothetical protein
MQNKKLPPTTLYMRAGADVVLTPQFVMAPGSDMTGWTAYFRLSLDCGPVLFQGTAPFAVVAPDLHIGIATITLPKAITERMVAGRRQHYFVRLSDGNGRSDIFLHGVVEAYVVAGAEP